MIVMTTELVAWSSTKATTIAATADSRSGVWSSASALFCTAVAPVRRRIISAVVSTLRAPTTPITGRMAASPNAPMMNVASGGAGNPGERHDRARVHHLGDVGAGAPQFGEEEADADARGAAEDRQRDHGERQCCHRPERSGERDGQHRGDQQRPEVVAGVVRPCRDHEGRDEAARVVDREHPADVGWRRVVQRDEQQRQHGGEERELQPPQQRRGGREESFHPGAFRVAVGGLATPRGCRGGTPRG